MKTRYLITILLCCSLYTFAQTNVSFVGGVSLSNIHTKGERNPFSEFTRRFSGHLGATVDFQLSDYSSVKTGAIYSSRGATISSAVIMGIGAQRSQLRLDFIEIPALYVRHTHNFEAFIGPQFSYLVAAKATEDGEKVNIRSFMKESVIDARAGIGFSPGRVGFQFSYIKGLSLIYEDYRTKWKNNAFLVSVSWRVTGPSARSYRNTRKDVPHRRLE